MKVLVLCLAAGFVLRQERTCKRSPIAQPPPGSNRVPVTEANRQAIIDPLRQVPAMVIDATLPAVPMLQAYFPQVEVAEPVEDDQRAASLLRLFT